MVKSRFLAITLVLIMLISSISIINISGPSEASDQLTFGVITWTNQKFVKNGQSLDYDNDTIHAQGGIQVNTSGYLNMTDCILYCAGNIVIQGFMKLDNVTLYMNSTTNGLRRIEVKIDGNFTVIDSMFTSSDTTSVNTYGTTAWMTSYGSNYRFTAERDSKMALINSEFYHVWGDSVINNLNGGGIRLYTDDALIDGCTVANSEISGVFVFGAEPTIKNSETYNNTFSQFLCISKANPIVDNNVFRNSPAAGGWGAYLFMDSEPLFTNNTVESISWSGMVIQQHSNATVRKNTIRNCTDDGVRVWGYPGDNGPHIDDNHIYNNSIGIHLQPFDDTGATLGVITGNISNNLVENNNVTGIWANNYAKTVGLDTTINSTIYKNTVVNNEGGVMVWECNPEVILNNISDNTLTGLYIVENSDPDVLYNTVSGNLNYGIFINTSSAPYVFDNIVQSNELSGIFSQNAEPELVSNNVSMNNNSGIRIVGQSSNFNIIGNNITLNTGDGIVINNSSPTIKDSNNIEANKMSGISVFNSTNSIISGNIIRNNELNGLLFWSSGGKLSGNNNISLI